MMNWYGGMGAAGWLTMSVLWVIVIAVVVWAVASLFSRGERAGSDLTERPEEILDRRLASGEIDPATYDALSAKLRDAHAVRR
jgi:putative membrane protein